MMINDRLVESCVRSFFRHQISKMFDRAHADAVIASLITNFSPKMGRSFDRSDGRAQAIDSELHK